MSIFLVFAFLTVSVAPFIQSGSIALLINNLVDIKNITESKIFLIIGMMILASLLPSIFFILQGYISKVLLLLLDRKIILMVMKKQADMDFASHENPKINDLIGKVTEQAQWRSREFAHRQYFLIQNFIEVAIASVILYLSSWWIFLIIFLGTVPELLVEVYYGKVNWGIWSAKAEDRRRFWDLNEYFRKLNLIQEIRIFQNIQHFFAMVKHLLVTFQNASIKNENKKLIYKLLSGFVSQAVISFAIFWFVFQVVHGNLLIGTLTFILASIGSFRQSLASLFQNLALQYEDSLFVTDMFKLLDLPKIIKHQEKGIVLDKHKTPEIVFENVTFKYPATENAVISNFSLKIAAGEKIAIVGINGAGKTTFVKLLCRFYDPTEGRITIDGHDLKNIDLESWYYQLGIIFQDYARYHFLVKDTIALGRTGSETDLEKVKASAKAAEADIFIEEWEKNYDQMLGREFTEGVEPSVGQWQKLALARTFYRDPNVLILDEPTSAIDAEAEAKIFEKLENLPDNRSVILISHRFSTVRQADKIVIIENGAIKENGTHEELIKLNGTYAKLFNLQAKGYK